MNSIEKYYVSAGIHHIVGKVGDFMSVLAENDAIASVMMWEAMDAVNDGIVIVDKTSRILYVNKAYTKILAVSKDKVLHRQVKTIEPGALILQVLQNREPVLHQLVEVKTRGKKYG